MTKITQAPTDQDLVTLTRSDLLALADKIASTGTTSKPAALNMIAATILGPKHDWSWIKSSKEPIISQRAQGRKADTPLEDERRITFIDEETGEVRDGLIKFLFGSSVRIHTDDGQIVWVERNSGLLKVHLYNDLADGPVSLHSATQAIPKVVTEDYEEFPHFNFGAALPAGADTRAIIGYQVDNPFTGENWANRPSYHILTFKTAQADLKAAWEAGKTDFRILEIRDDDIEEPTFE